MQYKVKGSVMNLTEDNIIELEPIDPLFGKFVQSLKETGVEIRGYHYPRAKYFTAVKNNRQLIVLVHESQKDEWWGVLRDIVERVEKLVKDRKILWGAALLDKSHCRGYWIPGDIIPMLKQRSLITLTKPGQSQQYHFKEKDLEKVSNMAPYFVSVEGFLKLVGLI